MVARLRCNNNSNLEGKNTIVLSFRVPIKRFMVIIAGLFFWGAGDAAPNVNADVSCFFSKGTLMCRIGLFFVALISCVLAGNVAQAVVIYNENFDGGANGQSILDPPFSYTENFGELGPPAFPIDDASAFAPSLAVHGAANTGGLTLAIKDIAGPTGAAGSIYTLTAKVFVHTTGAANGTANGFNDSWIGLAKPDKNGGLSFNNSGIYIGYGQNNTTNNGEWRIDARGVRSNTNATDVFVFSTAAAHTETVVDVTIRIDTDANKITGILKDGETTLTHDFIGGNDFSNITRFVIQQRYNGSDVDDILIEETVMSHGRQVLLNRGLQLQAWVFSIDTINPGFSSVDQFLGAEFTTVNFYQTADPYFKAQFQTQADVPWQWSRLSSSVYPDLIPGELPYVNNFASMQFGDELPQDQATLDAEKAAYARWNAAYPNTLAHTNFYGGQMDAASLTNYMQYTRPDLLMFDNYPGFSFSTSARNSWYSTMQLYRTVALKGYDGTGTQPLPYGQYLDLYRSSATAATPSESFVRLQQNASWAFGYTFTSAFVYNTPNDPSVHSVLFSGLGDSSPTPVLSYVAKANRESRNLGAALVRLVSTDIRMIPGSGRSVSGTGISAWAANANGGENYITTITPTVSQGGVNDTSYNDILIGYFKPLLADNSDYPFAEGSHFMIVNGASQGAAAASAQWYRLTFNFGNSGFNALERLSRETGLVELINLTHVSGSLYSLDLNLAGGTGDLFRYYANRPGDFDGNGDVDGADFLVWQRNFPTASGATRSTGDTDGDGDVDSADLAIWKTNFGSAPGPGSASVPEPAWFVLTAIAGVVSLARRRR